MSHRHLPTADSLLDAARVAEAVLRKKGSIDLSTIRAIPSVRGPMDIEAILGYLRSRLPISVERRVITSSPILRWENIVTVTNAEPVDVRRKTVGAETESLR